MSGHLPDDIDTEATALVRTLASIAGDETRVLDVLSAYARETSTEKVRGIATAALLITFGRCITAPASLEPGHPVPVTIPNQ